MRLQGDTDKWKGPKATVTNLDHAKLPLLGQQAAVVA